MANQAIDMQIKLLMIGDSGKPNLCQALKCPDCYTDVIVNHVILLSHFQPSGKHACFYDMPTTLFHLLSYPLLASISK